jgi:copper chaperone CopZ
MTMHELHVPDMKSEKCVATIRKAVTGLDGDARCEADLEKKRVFIDSALPPMDLVEAMEEVGYLATLVPQIDTGPGARKSKGS